jgi:hypothetical protein
MVRDEAEDTQGGSINFFSNDPLSRTKELNIDNLDEIELPERLADITFFSAYQEIISSVDVLEHLYTVWRNLPRSLQLNF